jgi:hypothetical protein
MPDDDEKLYADLWMKLSDQFWKHVALLPAIQLGVFASWYTLLSQNELILAICSLLFGAVVMGVAGALLFRTTQYITFFRRKISRYMEEMPEPWLRGRNIGIVIPALCFAANLVLAAASPFI